MIKITFIIPYLISLLLAASGQHAIQEKFHKKLEEAQKEYRQDLAKLLQTADKVELSIVKFDAIEKDEFDDTSKSVFVSDYKGRAEILKSLIVKDENKKKLINSLSNRLTSTKDEGLADCHYPVHGLKIWKDDHLIFESTFCWMCNNFTLKYPVGSQEMSANRAIKKVFNDILAIPESEIKRFNKKYPQSEKKQ